MGIYDPVEWGRTTEALGAQIRDLILDFPDGRSNPMDIALSKAAEAYVTEIVIHTGLQDPQLLAGMLSELFAVQHLINQSTRSHGRNPAA